MSMQSIELIMLIGFSSSLSIITIAGGLALCIALKGKRYAQSHPIAPYVTPRKLLAVGAVTLGLFVVGQSALSYKITILNAEQFGSKIRLTYKSLTAISGDKAFLEYPYNSDSVLTLNQEQLNAFNTIVEIRFGDDPNDLTWRDALNIANELAILGSTMRHD